MVSIPKAIGWGIRVVLRRIWNGPEYTPTFKAPANERDRVLDWQVKVTRRKDY